MLTRPRRLLALGLVVALGAATLSACQSDSGERVTIYSGRTQQLIDPILQRFAEEKGISVDVRYGDSSDLALLLEEEGDKSPADVFLSQSPGAIGFVDREGMLSELPESTLRRVRERFRAQDGNWVGISGRVRVLVYDTRELSEDDLPKSVFELTQPEYRGRVGIAPPNASFIDFVTAMRSIEGDERTLAWLRGLAANDVKTYPNNIAIVDAVNRGEIDMGLVNHYYNEQAKAEDPGIASANFVFPDGDVGALILVTAAGILKTSDNRDAAIELLDFLLSRESQEYFADETFEYPLAAGVAPAVDDLPPLDEIVSPPLDLSRLGRQFKSTRDLIQEAGIEV